MNAQQITDTLRNNYPYLTDSDIEQLGTIIEYKKLDKREVFISAGTKSKAIAFVMHGMIRGYFINEKGEERNVFLRPGTTIAGAPDALFQGTPTKYTFEAVCVSELLVMDFDAVKSLAMNSTTIGKLVIDSQADIIQHFVVRLEILIGKLPEERYEELLEKNPQFFQKAYNKDVANYLGITPVSLSRIIKRKLKAKN